VAEVNSNLKIWEKVQRTDPKRTKPFKGAGGFSGTAINATYLAQRATEVFGPMGLGWGMNIIEEKILDFGDDKIHSLRGELWYVLDGKTGSIQHFGQTKICGKNKHGAFVDEDAPKKSLTDVMSKCLSLLGFGADVHLGLYDDNRYVTHITNQIADERRAAREESKASKDADAEPKEDASQGDGEQQASDNVVPLQRKAKAEPEVQADPQTGEIGSEPLDLDAEMTAADVIKKKIDAYDDAKALGEYMNDRETQADMFRLGKEVREQVRDYAIKRHVELRAKAKAAAIPAE
jgi:hypothetical protein